MVGHYENNCMNAVCNIEDLLSSVPKGDINQFRKNSQNTFFFLTYPVVQLRKLPFKYRAGNMHAVHIAKYKLWYFMIQLRALIRHISTLHGSLESLSSHVF